MYQKSDPHHDDVLLHLRPENDDIVEGNLQLQVEGGDNCAEIFVTEGNAERYQILKEGSGQSEN